MTDSLFIFLCCFGTGVLTSIPVVVYAWGQNKEIELQRKRVRQLTWVSDTMGELLERQKGTGRCRVFRS